MGGILSSLEAAQHQEQAVHFITVHFTADRLAGKATIIKTVIPDVTELCSLKLFNWQWPVEQFCAATESLSAVQLKRASLFSGTNIMKEMFPVLQNDDLGFGLLLPSELIWDYRAW